MKTYTITIQKAFYGEYIVIGKTQDGSIVTSGKTMEQAIDMLTDAILTHEGVKIGWWNKLLHKLKRY